MTAINKRALLLIAVLALPSMLFAENIRGPLVAHLTLNAGSGEVQASVGVDDLLGISLGTNSRFIKGVEVTLTIPSAARRYRDLLALYLYKKVSPPPTKKVKLYSASRAGFFVLPTSHHFYVNVPLKANAIEPSPETATLSSPVPADQFPLLLSVLPVAKGLPGGVASSTFTVRVSPVLEDKGLLKLKLTEDGKAPRLSYSLAIDGHTVEPKPGGYELATGIHSLTITSSHYKQVTKSFGIDKGRTTSIDLSLKPLVPTILFEAPDNAQIFLDGQKLKGVPRKPIPVTEGQHTVIIREGDYSLTKKFTVERGRSYKISLFLDIVVQEN